MIKMDEFWMSFQVIQVVLGYMIIKIVAPSVGSSVRGMELHACKQVWNVEGWNEERAHAL